MAESGSTAVRAQGRLTATLLTLKWSDPNPRRGLRAASQPASPGVSMLGALIHQGVMHRGVVDQIVVIFPHVPSTTRGISGAIHRN